MAGLFTVIVTFGDRKTSAADFIENALKWFGDPKPEQGSQRDKGERLAELVREKKTLLIIDGIEALQYPPGEKQGRLKDPALQELLKELARSQPGLCVITTRLEVADIDQAKNRSAKTIYLKPLPSKVGAELLKELGVKGSVAELKNASEEYKGHAFSLGLLGRYLAVVHKGDIQKKELIPRLMDEEKKGGHGRRMLEFYEQFLSGKVELDILYLMGLFDRPAAKRVIKTLCTEHAIEGLTTELKKLSDDQWKYALKHMLDLNLLQTTKKDEKDKDKETLDCHPLLREYFGEKLRIINLEAWKTAHSKLYEYYKSLLEKKYPYTLDTLLSAVIHGSLGTNVEMAPVACELVSAIFGETSTVESSMKEYEKK